MPSVSLEPRALIVLVTQVKETEIGIRLYHYHTRHN